MNKKYLDLYSQLYKINLKIKDARDSKEIKQIYEECLKIINEMIKLEEENESV